ncbi:MAG: CHAP domain-containing protein [Ktedonobacteraceae bacterium]|nr:CHAP domain-containing protein [Ktedonobacteraceae bacterium]
MKAHLRSRKLIRQFSVVSFIVRSSVITAFGLLLVVLSSPKLLQADAQMRCAAGESVYKVKSGDTPAGITTLYTTDQQVFARHNYITSATTLHADQTLCPPVQETTQQVEKIQSESVSAATAAFRPAVLSSTQRAAIGASNSFPYGQCTWWANQRYHQLHGVYVPWTYNANAWQWTARAREFGWRVSAAPRKGDIIVLQPYVQGASGLGHVGVVEQVMNKGRVVASSMNWGVTPHAVTHWQFRVGSGVVFVRL